MVWDCQNHTRKWESQWTSCVHEEVDLHQGCLDYRPGSAINQDTKSKGLSLDDKPQLHFTLPCKYKRRMNLGSKHWPNYEREHKTLKNAKIHFETTMFHQKALIVLPGNPDSSTLLGTLHLFPAEYKVESETLSGCSESHGEEGLAILKSCSWSPTTDTCAITVRSWTISQKLVGCCFICQSKKLAPPKFVRHQILRLWKAKLNSAAQVPVNRLLTRTQAQKWKKKCTVCLTVRSLPIV